MLVLTRKKEETLHIGNDITLTILKIKGNSVQIGVEAPRNVRVLRGELTHPTEETTANEKPTSSRVIAGRRSDGGHRLRQMAAQVAKGDAAEVGMLQLV